MKCKRCGKKIPAARLKALPETEICVGCSATVGGDFIYVFREERISKPGSLKLNYGGITVEKHRRLITPMT